MTAKYCALLLLLLSSPAYALKISPFKAALIPDNRSASQVFRVENNSSEPAAVQVSVLSWNILSDGSEVNHDAEDDFAVFPAQLILKPHESRAVRIQWLGNDKPAIEKPYRLLAEQLPVQLQDTPGTGSAVRFMLRFKAALYVAQGTVQSDVAVTDVSESGDHKLLLKLVNKGTGHTLLRNPALHLTLSDGRTVLITGAPLKSLDGENIHAGHTRRFEVPLPADAQGKVMTAKLDFDPAF